MTFLNPEIRGFVFNPPRHDSLRNGERTNRHSSCSPAARCEGDRHRGHSGAHPGPETGLGPHQGTGTLKRVFFASFQGKTLTDFLIQLLIYSLPPHSARHRPALRSFSLSRTSLSLR